MEITVKLEEIVAEFQLVLIADQVACIELNGLIGEFEHDVVELVQHVIEFDGLNAELDEVEADRVNVMLDQCVVRRLVVAQLQRIGGEVAKRIADTVEIVAELEK